MTGTSGTNERPSRDPFLRLPAVYEWTDAEQGGFLRRLLAIPGEILDGVDEEIASFPALLDPARTPDAARPWLARHLGWPEGMPVPAERWPRVMAHAPELWRWRGTHRGLRLGLRLLVDDRIDIEERWARGMGSRLDALPIAARGAGLPLLGLTVARASPFANPSGRRRLARIARFLVPAHVAISIRVRRPRRSAPVPPRVGRDRIAVGEARLPRAARSEVDS